MGNLPNNIPEIWLQFTEEIENFSKGTTANEEYEE